MTLRTPLSLWINILSNRPQWSHTHLQALVMQQVKSFWIQTCFGALSYDTFDIPCSSPWREGSQFISTRLRPGTPLIQFFGFGYLNGWILLRTSSLLSTFNLHISKSGQKLIANRYNPFSVDILPNKALHQSWQTHRVAVKTVVEYRREDPLSLTVTRTANHVRYPTNWICASANVDCRSMSIYCSTRTQMF